MIGVDRAQLHWCYVVGLGVLDYFSESEMVAVAMEVLSEGWDSVELRSLAGRTPPDLYGAKEEFRHAFRIDAAGISTVEAFWIAVYYLCVEIVECSVGALEGAKAIWDLKEHADLDTEEPLVTAILRGYMHASDDPSDVGTAFAAVRENATQVIQTKATMIEDMCLRIMASSPSHNSRKGL